MRTLVLALALAALHPAGALACSLVVMHHDLDPVEQALDSAPPAVVIAELHSVHRGRGPSIGEAGQIAMTSCDDIGRVTLIISNPPSDDRTSAAAMGYLVRHSDGELPPDLMPLDKAVRIGDDGLLHLHWIDGATHDQETIDFSITVTAVDRAGNEGPVSSPIRVRHKSGS